MLQLRSVLKSADNSGAKKLRLIQVYRGSAARFAKLGDQALCAVDGAVPNSTVSDGEKVRIIIVRTKKETRRTDGSYIRFDDNAAVVIDKNGNPIGTRIFGPIAREIKDLGFSKIASLAKEVL